MLAAAAAVLVLVIVVVFTAAAFTFLVVMVMFAAAAAAAFFVIVMMVMTTAAAAAFFIIVMMVVAAATAAAAAVGMAFNANRFKGFFNFGHFKTDHAEHLGDVGKRKNGKAFGGFGHFHAAVDERGSGFLHRAEIAGDVKHLFNGGTNHPELALIVNENVVNEKRTLFGDVRGNSEGIGIKSIAPAHTLSRRENERMGTIENGLGRRRFGRQKLGKGRHL